MAPFAALIWKAETLACETIEASSSIKLCNSTQQHECYMLL
jgi:hypothetical protein